MRLTIKCNRCGGYISDGTQNGEEVIMSLEPCHKCEMGVYNEGYDDGWQDGYDEGEECRDAHCQCGHGGG